ncbi:type VI secretion system tip protein VgrG [Nitrosomonas supralitoralis]|uniref:Rhs element Vgr protein n=1 Tax=Nitrosomonas supralitoralis TaxID=2116706 RepID=A0A2P7NZU5_9PROT|nr:type VI secretion system tip protein VgrG [Nitrosomonas supralitoralis]PSJ18966.1 Rhs element Vgr protein [Nitrosomonas supralitoralis]
MADSPLMGSTGVLSVIILSNGQTIADTIQIVSIEILYAVNKIPSAKIILLDGDMPNADFPVSNKNDFKPGAEITINAGYANQTVEVFRGIIIKHGIKIDGDNFSRLIIQCKDSAVAMTVGRRNANFIDSKDSDIIDKIISTYSKLSVDVDATTTLYKELVQYYCTDWDYVVTRAEANGFLVTIHAGKVSVKAPQVSGEAVLSLTYGTDLMAFSADLDAASQFSTVKGVSWNLAEQAAQTEEAGPKHLTGQGDLDAADLSSVIAPSYFRLQTHVPVESAALTDWTNSQQIKSGLARIRGYATFQGSAKVKIGDLVELNGVGNRFNGNVLVTAVKHEIKHGNWVTEIEFGLASQWFTEQHRTEAPLASGLVPGVNGLQIGLVKKLDADPDGQYKIQVSVPIMQSEADGVWARLVSFYGSKELGAFFIPEIGDEVVLGFFNADPSYPVILGSLYSSNKNPAYELTADNFIKAIVTRSKLKLEFDDEKKVVTLITPDNNKIVISDDQKSILLQDQNANKIELNPNGIVIDSPKDIKISAKGKITFDAIGNIELTAQADIKNQGLNINQQANVGFSAKGNATAELSASGQTMVKGGIVMIN